MAKYEATSATNFGGGISLVCDDDIVQIYIDSKGQDYEGIKLVANSFADDVRLVTGMKPTVVTTIDELRGTVIIAGTIDQNDWIDSLIASGKLDVSAIRGKRESYLIRIIEQPRLGIDKAIVIAGSEKRGTIYGIYHLSELIGVSPWVYWGDVCPAPQSPLIIPESKLYYTSKEPSVKYRGIFINDEWPSFGSWTTNQFGGFNEKMYEKVFQLILRLKGNYLWPAMWSAIFSEDGERIPIANAELAHAYGIIMGTSHHEPMFRAGEEWQKIYRAYADNNSWDFSINREAITKFWEDGVIRNKDFENVITLGMRGERDSPLGGGLAENIERLKEIILTQKGLLEQHGLSDAPQALTIYKEVEHFWHGSEETPGLKHWDVLDDVTIILADDNFGNVRTLPDEEERERQAGWGMYYHFDYHGGPVSYEWVNTIPLEKIWEQMTMAYDYGVRELWVVNVGDLKPMELPISYFMELAYDFETWGAKGINKTGEYTLKWAKQQFGSVVDETSVAGIAQVLAGYTRMNGARKPEVTYPETFSCTHYREAERVLADAIQLEKAAKKYGDRIPISHKDAYYQLVYYPAVASANVKKMQVYAGLNHKYARFQPQSVLANYYARLVEQTIEIDQQMQSFYNNTMANGKWQGMMSEPHIGYVNWNADGWQYPEVYQVSPKEGSLMIVNVEGIDQGWTTGSVDLLPFNNCQQEIHFVTISNGGKKPFTISIETNVEWINCEFDKIDEQPLEASSHGWKGTVSSAMEIAVSIDWDQLSTAEKGIVAISGNGQTVLVHVTAEVLDTSGIPAMTFVEAQGVVSIEAEHTVNRTAKSGAEWVVLKDYGRTLSSVKVLPTTMSFTKPEDAPFLEYSVYVAADQEYILTAYCAPTNNLSRTSRLRYAISFDGGTPVIGDALPTEFIAGESKSWSKGVLDNVHISVTNHVLTKGHHTLRFIGLDAGLVLQKLVLSREPLPSSYYGPVESYCTAPNSSF